MFYGEHDENTLFSTENTRDTGHNFWRTCSLLFFLFAGENSMRGFPFFLSFVEKKGFENRLFQTRGGGKYPPFRTNIYIIRVLLPPRQRVTCQTRTSSAFVVRHSSPKAQVSTLNFVPVSTLNYTGTCIHIKLFLFVGKAAARAVM